MALTAEQHLIRQYRQAAKRLRQQMIADLRDERIGTFVYRRRQLEAIRRDLTRLGQRTRLASIEAIAAGYDRGAAIADVVSGRITAGEVATARYAFSGTHARPARVLAENMAGRLDQARAFVGRRVDDVYRRAALETVTQGVIAGDTRRDVARALERRLVRDGATGFVDRAGRQWQLDTYAEMVARTTTREAMSAGTQQRMAETGQQLITISDHSTDTDICQKYEGKTFALPGQTVEGYDTIDQLPPFHPRCLHVATPAADNLEALLRQLGVASETGAG